MVRSLLALMIAWFRRIRGCERRAAPDAAAQAEPPPIKPAAQPDFLKRIQESEAAAAKRGAEAPPCRGAVTMHSGSIQVDANDYGDASGLDRVHSSKAEKVSFTLDYPFEKPFAGTVTAPITLRRSVDAIRAGFRKMYDGAAIRDIPGMHNKEVTGPYGQSFHAIGDLVIEGVELCDDGRLQIAIGS